MLSAVGGGPVLSAVGGGPVLSAVGGGPVLSAVGGGPVLSAVGGGPVLSAVGSSVGCCIALLRTLSAAHLLCCRCPFDGPCYCHVTGGASKQHCVSAV